MTTDLEVTCPTCHTTWGDGRTVDGDEADPQPGDYSVCMMCGEILIFEDSLLLIYPNSQEFQALFHDSEAALYCLFKLSEIVRYRP